MTKRSRRTHSPAFEAKVALAAIKGEKTLSEVAQQFDGPSEPDHHVEVLEGAAGFFGQEKVEAKDAVVDLKELHAKIGELTLENDFAESPLHRSCRRDKSTRPSEESSCKTDSFISPQRLRALSDRTESFERSEFAPNQKS